MPIPILSCNDLHSTSTYGHGENYRGCLDEMVRNVRAKLEVPDLDLNLTRIFHVKKSHNLRHPACTGFLSGSWNRYRLKFGPNNTI